MDVARKLGILVFCAVPAVVGGGIVYYAFSSLTAVFIYEIILLVAAGAFVSR
jgi:zinc transporter ZupT